MSLVVLALVFFVPAVAVNLPEPVALFPDTAARKVQVSVQANVANAKGDPPARMRSRGRSGPGTCVRP